MKRTKKLFNFSFLLLLVFGLTLSACSSDDDDNTTGVDGDLSVVATAQQSDDFTILAQAIGDAGLTAALEADGPFTVFAPTDDAFNNLPDGTLENLTNEQLAEILQFHVVAGTFTAADISGSVDLETLQGDQILVQNDGGVVVNGDVNVTTADIEASNGVIHAIDEVLLPAGFREPTIVDRAAELGNFNSLLTAATNAGLVTTLNYTNDLTVFAPTDQAFAGFDQTTLASLTDEQLQEIITYHALGSVVVSTDLMPEQAVETLNGEDLFVTRDGEGNVTVNGSTSVVTADVNASNGVIHAIDGLLLPDAYGTVVDAASKRYFFEILVDAVVNAGLAEALSDTEASLTVFAPTDAAFEALPEGLLASLSTEQLAEILQYHVLPAEVTSGDLDAQQAPASLTGESVFVTTAEGTVTVNGRATVTTADVGTLNGTIHAIDEVILPNAYLDIVGIASKNYSLSVLVGLLADAGLVGTLQGDGPFTVFAPTDEAFDAISTTLEGLSEAQVEEVLTYHVAAGEALSGSLSDGQTIPTVQGEDITVNIDAEGNVTLNENVNVITVDLQGTNGVVHLIDGVLLPPSYGDTSGETGSATITMNNVGASAWEFTAIDGEGASATLNSQNTDLNLTVGNRYTFVNNGGSSHPLDFRDSSGNKLLTQDGTEGSFESDTDVNFAVSGDQVSFTLTQELADEIASYYCSFHASMNGSIVIQ